MQSIFTGVTIYAQDHLVFSLIRPVNLWLYVSFCIGCLLRLLLLLLQLLLFFWLWVGSDVIQSSLYSSGNRRWCRQMFTLRLKAVFIGQVGDGNGCSIISRVLIWSLYFLCFCFRITGVLEVTFLLSYDTVSSFVTAREQLMWCTNYILHDEELRLLLTQIQHFLPPLVWTIRVNTFVFIPKNWNWFLGLLLAKGHGNQRAKEYYLFNSDTI